MRKYIELNLLLVVVASLLFAGACPQFALFSSNQNTYFLSGLARGGYGYLANDWLANQTDHIPLFTWFVSVVQGAGHPELFYLVFYALAAVYAGSLVALCRKWVSVRLQRFVPVMFVLALMILHQDWDAVIINGVADQYVLGPILQPSTFGVLLITSIALFISDKVVWAVICALFAATVHPTYVLHAGVLTASYMLALAGERAFRRALLVGLLAVLLVIPVLAYTFFLLRPADPESLALAQEIIIEKRMPHHAYVEAWFSIGSVIQMAVVALGCILARSNKRLFVVLTFSTAVTVLMTCVQVLTQSRALALIFPWRMSVWLVPVCCSILLFYVVRAGYGAVERIFRGRMAAVERGTAIGALMLALMLCGGRIGQLVHSILQSTGGTLVGYVEDHAREGETYLIAPERERFRIASGVPVFVDFKSHPYKSDEVVAWYDRIVLARSFYEAPDADSAGRALGRIQAVDPVTHIVLARGQEYLLDAVEAWEVIFNDDEHLLVELRAHRNQRERGDAIQIGKNQGL